MEYDPRGFPVGFNGGDGNSNWGIFMTSSANVLDPDDQEAKRMVELPLRFHTTLAHEVGHYFWLKHRNDRRLLGGVPLKGRDKLLAPEDANVMSMIFDENWKRRPDARIDFDLAQVYVAHNLAGEQGT